MADPAEDEADEQPATRWTRTKQLANAVARLAAAIREAEPSQVEAASMQLGSSRRLFVPVGYAAGTIALLFRGMKVMLTNWRLSLIEFIPALWIWFTSWNLKAHFLHGRSLRTVHGPVVLLIAAAVILISVLSFWCNAVFA